MNRIVVAWLLPVALLVGKTAFAKEALESIELSDEDDGEVYRVPVGAEFEVRLRSAVGDATRWEMRDDPRFIAVDPPWREGYGNKRGDRENRVFKVRVTQTGRFPLVFEKLSTFGDSKRLSDRRVAYMIEAGAPGGGSGVDLTGWNGRLSSAGSTRTSSLPPLPPLHESDAGRVIHVPAGREIVILLPFASKLEQRWQVFASSNIGLTRAIAEQRDPKRKRNIFWLDSNSVIGLRPSGRGAAEVTLAYLPKLRDSAPTRQLRYSFVVD